jgi:hypothetical protein
MNWRVTCVFTLYVKLCLIWFNRITFLWHLEVKCAVMHWVFRKGYSVLPMVLVCCVTIETRVQRFYLQVPKDVIVSLRSGIREALDFLVVCCRIVLLEMPTLSFINYASCSYNSLNSHFKKLSHSLCSNVTSHVCFYSV